MRAAIELAPAGRVLLVAKESPRESASEYAQGGVAVALSDDDHVELHEQDTLYAGDGLCDPAPRPAQPPPPAPVLAAADVRAIAGRYCGILRDAAGLSEACRLLEFSAPAPDARNVRDVAPLIARAARAREESRGAHYRTDFRKSA